MPDLWDLVEIARVADTGDWIALLIAAALGAWGLRSVEFDAVIKLKSRDRRKMSKESCSRKTEDDTPRSD